MQLHRSSGIRVVFIASVLALVFNSVGETPATAATSPSGPAPRAAQRPATGGRTQFGPHGSGSVIVWNEQGVPVSPDETALGTNRVVGIDLRTNQGFTIPPSGGEQRTPAISGSLVVWEDNRQSCPTCERDIRGKDLASETEFVVANGPVDQAEPAIWQQTVVWVEHDGAGARLISKNLATQATSVIVAVRVGTTISNPAITDNAVVWVEQTAEAKLVHSVIYAYDRTAKTTKVIARSNWSGLQIAVSGQHVVWNDPRLWVADLATGTASILEDEFTTAPTISGNVVVWSAHGTQPDHDFDIYGANLADGKQLPLVTGAGNQTQAQIVGNLLTWQDDAGIQGRVTWASLAQLWASAPERQHMLDQEASQNVTPAQVTDAVSFLNYTRPTYKGIHLPSSGQSGGITYDGFYVNGAPCISTGCPIADGLGWPNAPFFGAMTVLQPELDSHWQTGRPAPYGPTEPDMLKNLQAQYGTRVIVRGYPEEAPNPQGNVNPADATQEVINLATGYDWIQNVQINNEPNIEWPSACTNCTWSSSGLTRVFSWYGMFDPNFFAAINTFYSDVWYELTYWKSNYSDPTIRAHLQSMKLWTPPMADSYRNLDNGQSMYVPLQNMITIYGDFLYHTYPSPSYDAVGGGLSNNSWPFFTSWLTTNIGNGSIPSMITEWGWNPGQMINCGLKQYSTWPASGACAAHDGVSHTLSHDVKYFLTTSQRHGAQAVTVWLMRGFDDKSEGIDQSGHPWPWFHAYQFSTP